MDDTPMHAGARGAHYEDDRGEATAMETGVGALGTPAAGAGPDATVVDQTAMPAGSAHHTLHSTTPPPVDLASEAGEQPRLEYGMRLAEEGQQAAEQGSGEVF